ncbi:E3 ubiquitin-protein ligase TRIM71-like [Actinia tenebrosa]|uniref:E3 ubiquitin-protein ligase TRIM71-like n=1 Tax=Actinia tenebrosa TaxID=6105 RepID=A0A6P8J0Y8_ACTTE|nr:E3 ubiquitin-protein ligase TRIM71-like [Actinia tenebrosa]
MEGVKCFTCHREAKSMKVFVSSRFVCEDCLTVLSKDRRCCLDYESSLKPSSNNAEGVITELCQDTNNLSGVARPFFEGDVKDRLLNVPVQMKESKRAGERRYYPGKCFASDSNLPRLVYAENSIPIDSIKMSVHELNGQTTKPNGQCEKHDMEETKFYCQTCEIRICRDCAILDHRDHDFVYYKEHLEAEETPQERLKKLLDYAEQKQVVLNEKLQNLDSRLERKSKAIEEARIEIKSKTLKMKELISEQEDILMSCLEGHLLNVTRNVKSQKSALESALDDVNYGLEIAQEMIKKNSPRSTRKFPNGLTNLKQRTSEVKTTVVQMNGVATETGDHGNHPEKEAVSQFESEADFCDDKLEEEDDDDDDDDVLSMRESVKSLRGDSRIDDNLKVPLPKNPTFDVSLVFGVEGSGNGQFREPVGITVSSDGTIFVADYDNDRLQVFDKKGQFLRNMTHVITGTGRTVNFLCPTGLATDKSGNIVVAERGRHRITVISPEGHVQRKFGKLGKARGQFRDPHGVSVDKRGRIIVADTTNNRIQVFDQKGDLIFTFGHKGEHVLDYPNYAIFHKGLFIVSDTDNDSVKIFDKEGQFLRTLGNAEKEGEPFGAPSGLAVYKDDYILVCDFNNDCVKMFSLDGEFVTKIGREGTSPGEFSGPEAVVVTSDDKIIVTDKNNSRVQMFELKMDLKSPG